ncbi:hypothetical protein L596_003264 [Steinernema carpocapsae]|uniref:SDH assembly factor 2 n=1 Tax=Steinernema carpocapsae TaxID=34508 RepID=A0A4U8UTM2_STECR|nr:hypothetical protein L596_003264 [Steinernema carpocapsae]
MIAMQLRGVVNLTTKLAGRTFSAAGTAGRNNIEEQRSRLLYQSKKRGILENDIIIGGFAEKTLPFLNQEQLDAYDRIINGGHMEWDLFYYVSGKKAAPKDLQDCSVFQIMVQYANEKKQ